MAAFSYRALDTAGQETRGTIEADNARLARTQLRERGLYPTELEAVTPGAAGQKSGRIRGGNLVMVTRQLSALLNSGLTVEQALVILAEQADDANTRTTLAAVRSEIVGGHSLRAALERFSSSFPPIYRASVSAGEKSGQLGTVMERLADYLERQDSLRKKTLQSLLYPAIVGLVAFIVVIALMTYVVPQVVEVFEQGQQKLPLLTRMLIGLSDFLRSWGWVLLVLVVIGFFAARRALQEDALRRRWDAWLLRLPLLGKHLRALDTARFASTLAILVSSGVPLLAALDAGRQIITRLPLRDAVASAADKVREGMGLAAALRQTRAFPPLLVHMIASGEATGDLAHMLFQCAQLQQNEVESRTTALTTLLEPALLLFMGSTVLVIVLAIMQPIIEINTLLK